MKPIDNWENVQASTDFKNLPAGGYVVVIRKATEMTNPNGKAYLEILCDIAEGEFKGFAEGNEKLLRKMDAYSEGKASGLFKRFINSVTASNRGFKWNWNENALVGKIFGVVMYEEDYEKDGEIRTATKIWYPSTYSADDIRNGNFETVKNKKLDKQQPSTAYTPAVDEDVPF